MNIQFNKKSLTALALAGCLLSTGMMTAYFTDTESQSANATAGNIDLVWTNKDMKSSNSAQFDAVWEAEFDEDDITNPGDSWDFSYNLENTGSKSIDVKQQIVLTSTVPFENKGANGVEEYTLDIVGGTDTTKVVGVVSDDKKTITYDLGDIILDGSVEKETTGTGALKATTTDYSVKLNFDLGADNSFMNSTVSLSYQAYAKQHRNAPDTNWENVANYEAIN